ncbi:type II toxin-antitoxin system ParD family antitoxin [Parabacteroides sp. OttesenSCG-928-O15]|nr:type II toxin-antitoxin system ParD family antitoxin [Parabacteroides sp. OttesenSCG-928-O15]
MRKNTPVTPGDYFEGFVENRITQGRYKNASEVIRARLKLSEKEEKQKITLKIAIQEGFDSGTATHFNPEKHLQSLKAQKQNYTKK